VIIGVVPAAGYATRLQPIDCSKEVYPVRGRPVIDFLIERMRVTGADELRVVTRPDKRDVVEHAHRLDATVVEGTPRSVGESLALGIRGVASEDIVLFGFPDTLWEPPDGFARLLPLLDSFDVVLGLFHAAEPERSDVVVLDGSGAIERIVVKPGPAPPSDLIWGCCVARGSALAGVASESEPGAYFERLAREGRVGGLYLSDVFVDIGTPKGLRLAAEA
jgi:NDP-sugar pyrophosphorylase family protein